MLDPCSPSSSRLLIGASSGNDEGENRTTGRAIAQTRRAGKELPMYVRSRSSADRQNHLCANCSSALTPCSPLLALLKIAADRPRSTTSRAGNLVTTNFLEDQRVILIAMAERGGFEPPIRLPVCRISSAVLSTTQPPLRAALGCYQTAAWNVFKNVASLAASWATATLEPQWPRLRRFPTGTRAGRVAIAALVQPFKRIAPQNISAQSLRGYGAAQPRKETAEVAEAQPSAGPSVEI